ncbi:acyltransferase family protein [Chondromyces apiculatus]|uniref:Acyltransferase 3 n=1 Tax=Chondromyces apiculatus DSM 436 TaxID=1192034 RepID=A0A017SZN8_9BACT|nr:acyltransferase [Chondromyces apiculatus]EYF02232.1 Acyltransferase 3 [Chondromyces apiculatus DSM 436]
MTSTAIAVPPAATQQRRLTALTGYRFALASTILFTHTFYSMQLFHTDPAKDPLALSVPVGTAAVSSFFVLSGFVLAWSAPASDTFRAFWRRRAVKVYPNHALTWLATVIFLLVVTTPSLMFGTDVGVDADKAILNLLLLQNWVPRMDYIGSINGISWSVCCEAFFYAVFPFLFPVLQRIPAQRLWHWFAVLGALVVVIPGLTYLLEGPDAAPWARMPVAQIWLAYAFPPTRLLEFMMGILTARMIQTGRWPHIPVWAPLLVSGLIFLTTPVLPAAYLFGAAEAVPMALVVPALATRNLAGQTGWLDRPGMVLLGNASYALYLCHYPILRVLRHVVGPQRRFAWWSGTLIGLVGMAMSLLVAVLVYTYFEDPIVRRFSRRRASP